MYYTLFLLQMQDSLCIFFFHPAQTRGKPKGEIDMKLEGSKTEANLIAALAGESQASVKYQLYAEKARQDGYEEMAQIF